MRERSAAESKDLWLFLLSFKQDTDAADVDSREQTDVASAMVRIVPLFVTVFSLVELVLLTSCAITPRGLPTKFYSYWERGVEGTGLMGTSTSYYVDLFSKRGPRGEFLKPPDKDFYYACLGDVAAFRRFLHSEDRGGIAAIGEGWDASMAVLVLKYGDGKLAQTLRGEKQDVKESVAVVIERLLKPDDRALYPKTRALYKYRFNPVF